MRLVHLKTWTKEGFDMLWFHWPKLCQFQEFKALLCLKWKVRISSKRTHNWDLYTLPMAVPMANCNTYSGVKFFLQNGLFLNEPASYLGVFKLCRVISQRFALSFNKVYYNCMAYILTLHINKLCKIKVNFDLFHQATKIVWLWRYKPWHLFLIRVSMSLFCQLHHCTLTIHDQPTAWSIITMLVKC